MTSTPDSTLFRRYLDHRDEHAFAELVQRYVNLVYFAALRQIGGNTALAEEITQSVFTDLARKAVPLSKRPSLAGWLYTSTRFAATKVARSERRRRSREQEACVIQQIEDQSDDAQVEWERLRPSIDHALHTLGETDRDAIFLRFFENRPFAEIGAA